jgi:hypothetical protein
MDCKRAQRDKSGGKVRASGQKPGLLAFPLAKYRSTHRALLRRINDRITYRNPEQI